MAASLVRFLEHPSSEYGPRTAINAKQADFTIAFAVDFETAGERLTRNLAMPQYKAIDLKPLNSFIRNREITNAAMKILIAMDRKKNYTINVAGNSLHSLRGITQQTVNRDIFCVLQIIHETVGIGKIVTGGQTGADWAGVVTAKLLNIPCDVTMPKGFRQRTAQGIDTYHTVSVLRQRLRDDCRELGKQIYL